MAANPKKSVAPNALAMFDNLPGLGSPQAKAEVLAVINRSEIRIGAFLWTPIGLQIEGEITQHDWEETGRLLRQINVSLQWIIGDFIVAGENLHFGQQEELAEALGFQYGTIRTYATVARSVDLSIRVDKLPFKHHQIVAPLSHEMQSHWLNRALEGDGKKPWSAAKLLAEIEGDNESDTSNRFAKSVKAVDSIKKRYSKLEPHEQKELVRQVREWLESVER